MSPTDLDWWRGSVIYQIYPRSFFDSSGDGIGDLAGITARLDYLAALGVDAVWISPFQKSPMKDFGYDVSDYRAVDPIFGHLDDFVRLVERAHALGMKILMDKVLSHTSDEHPWFVDSKSSRDADRADWYVWADARPDGTPPNNWLSIFGGPAWQWEPRRRQYYLHNFLVSQPDLNFHNPAVVDQLLSEVEFWLELGVDGFRLDTANYYFHDAELRDNPVWPAGVKRSDGIPPSNPYGHQRHVYDKTRPETIGFLRKLRALLDRYPGAVAIGEITADDSLAVMAEYTAGGDKLHMGYTFDLLGEDSSAAYIGGVIKRVETGIGDGWPCWTFGNHDVIRVLTRWGGPTPRPELAKVLMAMLLSLRGSVCVYQGDELGLTEAEVPYEKMRDPYGLAFWPEYKGRDGCRTPMPWDARSPHAGFSPVEPWLPVPEEHRVRAVSVQDADPDSVLNTYRRFLGWRRDVAPLRAGDIEFLDVPEPALALVRTCRGERLLAAFNLGAEAISIPIASELWLQPLHGHGFEGARHTQGRVELPGYGAFFARVDG
jgi:alpha-glucosidase